MSTLNSADAIQFVESSWAGPTEYGGDILKSISDYISVPNQSPQFDPEVFTNGLQEKACEVLTNWLSKQKVNGMKYRVVSEKERTPLIFVTIDGTDDCKETIMMYGHMDKQPPMANDWFEGLGPHTPVLKGEKLYGRGGADDGYSIYAAINSIQLLQRAKQPHARIVILVEGCEESGSRDLPWAIELLKDEIGIPSLVVCLDSGCANYDQLWLTTSLRGLLMATLRVDVLDQAVHSGPASGIVASSFRILRQLLDRIEDSKTGQLTPACYATIPEQDTRYAAEVGATVGDEVFKKFPFVGATQPISSDLSELVLGATWKPTLCITGVDGIPSLTDAGNVLRSHTTVKLSVRLPPTVNPADVAAEWTPLLTNNVPYNAKVTFNVEKAQGGWKAPALASWLEKSLNESSRHYYQRDVRLMGEGGSIPFMGMLGEKFPETQFVITGVLGPGSSAHGPNEFLHVPFAQKLTCCVAEIVKAHYVEKVQAK